MVGAMGAVASTTKTTPDGEDWTTIAIVSVIIFILYLVLFTVRVATKDEPEEDNAETLMERWSHVTKGRWAIPKLGVRSEAIPAICSRVLSQNKDVPLLIPMEYLQRTPWVGWSADILGGTTGARLFKACLLPAARGRPRCLQVLGHGIHGEPDSLLVSISAGLEISNGDGKLFGKIARRGNGEVYMLEEATGKEPRWAIVPDLVEDPSGATMSMTWKPKGRLLATVAKGTRYLNVTNTHGVDAILALACALGLMTFEFAPGPSLSARLKDVRDQVRDQVEGTAASLLTRLHPQTNP
uniref:Uncharacterized protein n=1 Tax=Alexandrium catenella TaxID=2925 RepID=A0A7S1WIB6_ALECA